MLQIGHLCSTLLNTTLTKQNSSAINLFFSVNGQQQKAREATWLQKNKAQVPTLKERKSEVKKRHSGKARGNCDSRY